MDARRDHLKKETTLIEAQLCSAQCLKSPIAACAALFFFFDRFVKQ
jgi:hypothetical protein